MRNTDNEEMKLADVVLLGQWADHKSQMERNGPL